MFPCGLTRREAIWEMGGGFAGLALLAQESVAHASGSPGPHIPTKVKSCIFLMMNGGPSQVDTFDPKPALEKFAGTEIPKDKKFINSGGRKIGFLTPAFRKFHIRAEALAPPDSPADRRKPDCEANGSHEHHVIDVPEGEEECATQHYEPRRPARYADRPPEGEGLNCDADHREFGERARQAIGAAVGCYRRIGRRSAGCVAGVDIAEAPRQRREEAKHTAQVDRADHSKRET